VSPADRVRAAYARIDAVDRPEVWIHLRPIEDVLADAERATGPLAGSLLAVKDNVDVAGLPTTAACPAYAYVPTASAPAVERLIDAGAVVLGKTNLDQFATGLVGTRSPYGAVRDMRRPDHVSGGSSSGSALAVALGIADIAIGTDTAGSGRVPAAFQGIVGVKPTRGLVPTTGVVPACRTLDCVTSFGRTLAEAESAAAIMTGSATWPADAPLGAPPTPTVGVPPLAALIDLTPAALAAFDTAVQTLADRGCVVGEIELAPFVAAGRLLYGGGFVAERHAAVGSFVDFHRDEVDPIVGEIIAAAGEVAATRLVSDGEQLDRLRAQAATALSGFDALLVPTTARQPTLAEVAADPVGANAALGRYTNCCNLLDLSAVAVPAGEADGGCFGVTVYARGHADAIAADVAGRLAGPVGDIALGPPGVDLLVVGAHLDGQPLNHELTDRGARFVAAVRTAPAYALHRLDTEPPKPGLVRVGEDGAAIEGEVWRLPVAALGGLLADLPAPMMLGPVELEDGRAVVGFGCEPAALAGAEDITAFGGWAAYLDDAAVRPA
jgi:allophanate hydrolase